MEPHYVTTSECVQKLSVAQFVLGQRMDDLTAEMESILKEHEGNIEVKGHLTRIQNCRKKTKDIQTTLHTIQDRLNKIQKTIATKYPNLNQRWDTFGIPLVDIMKRDDQGDKTPKLVSNVIKRIREIGIDQKTLFKQVSGDYIKDLVIKLDTGDDPKDLFSSSHDLSLLTGILKQYLTDLPDPLCTFAFYDQFIQIAEFSEVKHKIEKLRILIHKLPEEHETLLYHIVELLHDISKLKELNKLDPKVMSMIIGVAMLQPPEKDQSRLAKDLDKIASITETLIEYYPQIFLNQSYIDEPLELKIRDSVRSGSGSTSDKRATRLPLDKKYTGFRVNFLSVFTNQDMREGFIEHLKEEENCDPFEFLLEIESFPNDTTPETIARFNKICDHWIVPGKAASLNIPGTERGKILNCYKQDCTSWDYKDTPLGLMGGTRDIAFSDLKFDAFPRFIYSERGYEIISKNRDNSDIITQNPLYSVIYKLKDSFYGSQYENEAELREFAGDLSDKHRLKQTYLSTNWVETQKLESRIKMTFRRKNLENSEETETMGVASDRSFKGNVKIKIVVIDKSSKEKPKKQGFINFLSPVLSTIGGKRKKNEEVEVYTTALMIGPWYFEWDESELCIPKKCISSAAILSADVDEVYTMKNLDEKIEKLSEKVCEWNVAMGYRKNKGVNERYGNSQEFVESVLEAIGVRLNLPEALSTFLAKMKEKGSCKLEFSMNKEFQKKFGQKTDALTFFSHGQLDDFVLKLLEIDKSFATNHRGEYLFLKSFDRAFWMRHLNIKSELSKITSEVKKLDEMEVIEQEDVERIEKLVKKLEKQRRQLEDENERVKPGSFDCPFKDPTKTQSIIF